ncbi:hypothetical protein jhhlp_006678 [Lomentospora prolificans]|uniref:Uncharacterized protein n=1 Tax=Lomentospora prolificans TaxID=41688 RepID=A0A2N3N6L8_9PEZI|nr:hypothetical protein jhhlp_006678 [Lomentospora prolificans]
MGSSHSTLATPQLSAEAAKKGIPPVIRVAFKKSWKDITLYLSEPDSETSYCVTLPKGWWGSMTLHDGSNEYGPPIAHALGKGKSMVHYDVASSANGRRRGEWK